MRDNFISTIVNFDTDDVTDDVRLKMKKYLENPDYNFEKVSHLFNRLSSRSIYDFPSDKDLRFKGRGCSAAVEHWPCGHEDVSSMPVGHLAFFFIFFFPF